MKKITVIIIFLVALTCMCASAYAFLSTGNGLWAIFSVLSAGIKVAAISDVIEMSVDEEFVDRFYGKGGES